MRGPFRWGALAALFSARAMASNVMEFPDNGSEQLGRGGAWIARASDPLAAFYNPAGLAGQPTRATLQANLVFSQTCFSRLKAPNDTTQDRLVGADGVTYPQVCSDGAPQFPPNAQLAMTWSLTPRLGLGFAFLAPSGVAKASWPEFVTSQTNPTLGGLPAPQRYMMLSAEALYVTPTLGVGYEIVDGLRLGASFQWGIASAKSANGVAAFNNDNANPQFNDLKAELSAADYFVPGGTVGALWSPSEHVDVAGWFKFSKNIDATGDLVLHKNYFSPALRKGEAAPGSRDYEITDTSKTSKDPEGACGTGVPGPALVTPDAQVCRPGLAKVTIPVPVELKIGVRFHQPRERAPHVRDPMRTDKWDAEIDVTWAHDSALQALKVRFPANIMGGYDSPDGTGIIPVNGLAGSPVPANSDVPRDYRDVLGVRVGGDVNVLPDKLAVRAGGFFETQATNTLYQNVDFIGGARLGLALGATWRLRLSKEKSSAVELSAGFMHMFVLDTTNKGPDGLTALAGTACNPTSNQGSSTNPLCTDGHLKYRTNWAVNLGTVSSQLSAVNVGASYRF